MLLQRDSTVDELAGRLTEHILSGRLGPGARLRETEFAARFDVSRNTLREALHRLARDGLVVHRPHRGVTVARPSRADVSEIFRIRRVLESAGLQVADPSLGAELSELAARMEEAAAARDWPLLVDLDLRFHARLVSGLESARLDEFFATLLRELRLSFVLIDSRGAKVGSPSHVPDHGRIADDLRGGRVATAAARLDDHLRDAEDMVLSHLNGAATTTDGGSS